MKLRALAWTVSLGLTLALGTVACSDDHDDDHGHAPGEHEPTQPSCVAIMEACHEADTDLMSRAHECHELAHTDVEGDCAAQRTSCVQTCEAVLQDSGVD